ncbi:MBL fold metallo-hydrolase [Pectinatus sottacetonis]|uniref:MBL fold metallo-hydrolase n=1 Tax=Pectinatus sottacetonis TaxID=1002795 RepID=UPI0018C712E5|nr:MBL fold metallo-hydrolase [Pectinatus sottacetonis]
MKVKTLINGSFEENCYMVIDETTNEALVIDPGSEPERILNWLKGANCTIKYVLNTHGHSDHIGCNTAVCDEFKVKLGIHPLDAPMLINPQLNLSTFWGMEVISKPADFFLNENDIVTLGKNTFKIIHTPGHSPGGICIVNDNIIFSGDSLFAESIGRTDFPGGSTKALVTSLKNKILPLDNNVIVYPGHGPTTTIGHEKDFNPYFSV